MRFGGAATVLNDLISAAVADQRFSSVAVLCSPRHMRQFEFLASPKIHEVEIPLATGNRLFRWWWLEHRLGDELANIKADVFLSMCGAGRSGHRIPQVTFIQQSLPFSPEACSLMTFSERVRIRAVQRAMKTACRASRTVLVQTELMKRTVHDALGIPPEKIVVVPTSVAAVEAACSESDRLGPMRASPHGRRILYVGHASKYKNVEVLVDAVNRLSRRLPDIELFLTTREGDVTTISNNVAHLGYLSPAVLAEAYRLADVLVMPSLQETVGLPMLEAMNVGLPVVAADRPYAREVCKDAALFFDPLDAEALAVSLRLLLSDAKLRRGLAERGLALSRQRQTEAPYTRMLDILAAAVACPQSL